MLPDLVNGNSLSGSLEAVEAMLTIAPNSMEKNDVSLNSAL
jgi:citrate lyase gamma subunit